MARPIRRGQPTRAGSLLSSFVRRARIDAPLMEAAVRDRWQEIAGPRVAARTEPLSLRDGLLTLGVANSAWLNELAFLRHRMVPRVNEILGRPVVREVRLVARPASGRAPPRPTPSPPPPPPLPAAEALRLRRRADDEVAHLPPGPLRDAIRDARLAQLRRGAARGGAGG